MGRWGTYPKNDGDPQNDVDEDQETVDREDDLVEYLERQRERKIERDNEKY